MLVSDLTQPRPGPGKAQGLGSGTAGDSLHPGRHSHLQTGPDATIGWIILKFHHHQCCSIPFFFSEAVTALIPLTRMIRQGIHIDMKTSSMVVLEVILLQRLQPVSQLYF